MNRKQKHKWDWLLKKHICNIPNDSKIVYYKNPNECNRYYLERVNPNHVGILWGKRKNKSKNWIQIGRVVIKSIALPFYYIGKELQSLLVYLLDNLDITICCYYIFLALMFYAIVLNVPFIEGVVACLHR